MHVSEGFLFMIKTSGVWRTIKKKKKEDEEGKEGGGGGEEEGGGGGEEEGGGGGEEEEEEEGGSRPTPTSRKGVMALLSIYSTGRVQSLATCPVCYYDCVVFVCSYPYTSVIISNEHRQIHSHIKSPLYKLYANSNMFQP
jgi:hypothetical protein